MVEEFLDKNQKNKYEQVKNLEWTKLKGLLGEKALDRQSKEKQHSEGLGFKSEQLQAQKQQNSFDNKLKLAELIGKKPSKKSIYTTVAENFGSKGYGAFFKGLFSALGHKDQEEMSEKQANEMMKYLQQAEAIDYIKNTNQQLDQMQKKAQLQKQADEYFQTNYQKLMGLNLPSSEKQNVIAQVIQKAGNMAGETKTLDGIGNNGDLYIKNQKGNIIKVAGDPVENAISNYRDLQNNYQYPQANSSIPYQKLVNDQHQTRINYDPNGRMRTQQPQNPIQVEQRQENIQQDSQQEQPKEEPWMANMDMAKNNVDSKKNADQYSEKEKQPYYVREAQRLYFEDRKELRKKEIDRVYQNITDLEKSADGENLFLKNYSQLNNVFKKIPEIEKAIKEVGSKMGSPYLQIVRKFNSVYDPSKNANADLIDGFASEVFGVDGKIMTGVLTDQDRNFIMRGIVSTDKPQIVAEKMLRNLQNRFGQKIENAKNQASNVLETASKYGIDIKGIEKRFKPVIDDINGESQQQNSATQAQNFSGSSFKKVKGGYVLVR